MRQPTPISRLYAWHRAMLEGRAAAIHEDEPQCGWFKTRLVKGGPFVPASISIHREIDENGDLASDERLVCEVNGAARDPYTAWSSVCKNPISRADYLELKALHERRPEMAATHVTINLNPWEITP